MSAFDSVSHASFVDMLRARHDAMCSEAADRIGYLFAQEDLLEAFQQRAEKAEAAINEVQRPLDAQMARLNRRVIAMSEAIARPADGWTLNALLRAVEAAQKAGST